MELLLFSNIELLKINTFKKPLRYEVVFLFLTEKGVEKYVKSDIKFLLELKHRINDHLKSSLLSCFTFNYIKLRFIVLFF